MPVHSTGSSDPAQRGAAKRGDLYLRFNIIFPSQINEDHKREIEELLDWENGIFIKFYKRCFFSFFLIKKKFIVFFSINITCKFQISKFQT